jgi:hypothetical protein
VAVAEVVAITAEVKTAIFAADRLACLGPYLRDFRLRKAYGATSPAVAKAMADKTA